MRNSYGTQVRFTGSTGDPTHDLYANINFGKIGNPVLNKDGTLLVTRDYILQRTGLGTPLYYSTGESQLWTTVHEFSSDIRSGLIINSNGDHVLTQKTGGEVVSIDGVNVYIQSYRVLYYDGTSWSQKGNDISYEYMDYRNNRFSSDGSILVTITDQNRASDSGIVNIFKYNGTTYEIVYKIMEEDFPVEYHSIFSSSSYPPPIRDSCISITNDATKIFIGVQNPQNTTYNSITLEYNNRTWFGFNVNYE